MTSQYDDFWDQFIGYQQSIYRKKPGKKAHTKHRHQIMTITVSYTPQNHPFTIHLSFFLGLKCVPSLASPQKPGFFSYQGHQRLADGKRPEYRLFEGRMVSQWCPNGVPMVSQWCHPNYPCCWWGLSFFWLGVNSDCKRWDISLMAGWFYFVDLSASSDFLSDMGI